MTGSGEALRVAVLLSGGGRSLANLLEWRDAGKLPVDFVGVIASRPKLRGLEIAEAAGLPTRVIRRKDFENLADFSAANTEAIKSFGADFVVMAGYLSFYELPPDLIGRTINIHPALLPNFGGQGYYGDKVHAAGPRERRPRHRLHRPLRRQRLRPRPDDPADPLPSPTRRRRRSPRRSRLRDRKGRPADRAGLDRDRGEVRWAEGKTVFAEGLKMPWRPHFD